MMTKEMSVSDFAKTFAPAIQQNLQQNFGLALADYVDALQARITAYYTASFPSLTPDVVTTEPGNKYVKVLLERPGQSGRSVQSFVRIADGAILYAASFKKPFIAKGGPNAPQTVRGSIYVNNGMDAVTVTGSIRTVR